MGKFYGKVGFITTEESGDYPGVYKEVVTEKTYYGEVLNNTRRWQGVADQVNDDVNMDARITILCDQYAFQNLSYIRFVEWMGSTWKVNSVEPSFPRLILSIGGVYNGLRAS